MKKLLFLMGVFSTLTAPGQSPSVSITIQNVNVLDVRKGTIVPNMSVVVSDGMIVEVGKHVKTKTSDTIDGSGKYLMPGMVDGHIHFFQSGGFYTRPDGYDFTHIVPYAKERETGFNNTPSYFRRYLRLGITTVIDQGGPFSNFDIRDSIASVALSPNVRVTGPLFSMIDNKALDQGDPPMAKTLSIKQADSLFQKLKPHHPDFLKIWYIVSPDFPAEKTFPVVKHIAKLAHEANIKLTVHATELKTAQLAVEAGADVLVHSVEDAAMPDDFINTLVTRKVTYIPTLISAHKVFTVGANLPDHHPQDVRYGDPFIYESLNDGLWIPEGKWPANYKKYRPWGMPPFLREMDSVMAINIKKAADAGVNVVAGTDAGNPAILHGSSYLQELQAMKNAGLTNAQILRAATINSMEVFSLNSGVIEPGRVADMLLLTKSPLDDLDNLNAIEFVIKSGTVLRADTIVKETSEMLVQRQVVAFNARNIDAFIDTYADDVELYVFPDSLIGKGTEQMRAMYSNAFKDPKFLPVQIVNRISLGNTIIDHERFLLPDKKTVNAVAVYEVRKGKIKKVTFIDATTE